MLCTSLVGCWNMDKSKDTKNTGKQPQQLPGTPMLQPGQGNLGMGKSGQQALALPAFGLLPWVKDAAAKD
jgi:hypothetical protein